MWQLLRAQASRRRAAARCSTTRTRWLALVGWANPAALAQLQSRNPSLGFEGAGDLLRAQYAEQVGLALSFGDVDGAADGFAWLTHAPGPS